MNNTTMGLAVGLALGFAVAFGGATAFIVVLVFSAAGLIVGRLLDGEYDLQALAGSLDRRTRRAHTEITASGREQWSRVRAGVGSRLPTWQMQVPAWRLRMPGKPAGWRRHGNDLDQTAVIDLRHLTGETVEIRQRSGLAWRRAGS